MDEKPTCGARTTVQMGRMVAQDLQCVLTEWEHDREGRHKVGRNFGHVTMVATWSGEFEGNA